MIVFNLDAFMNHIATLFFPTPTILPAREMPTAKISVLILSNLQFRHESMVLHTWTTLYSAYLLVINISNSLTLKSINGDWVPVRWSIN